MVLKTKVEHRYVDDCLDFIELIATPSGEMKTESDSDSSFEIVIEPGKRQYRFDTFGSRRVKFSKDNQIFPISTRREISGHEKRTIWYRHSELKRMRRTNGELDKDCAEVEEDALECQRALHQLMAVSVVLDEQDRQSKLHITDPVLISEKYQAFVARSRQSIFLSNLVTENTPRRKARGSTGFMEIGSI